ncbi:class I SAM-dependent methyltransferase [Nocardioides sp. cx-169]|uniref:class I SAM-dependent methyltransferase n=1 Tax=Nocardioides sp. cx-169 TaxID=2899080 RepID=UPI001E49AE81|nr:class I SAM-dependent methyltransferase [Nocardioides sp. cx-169]MCD4534822.1 class I SAM-dependent methyltransferase [Nocardioides sp. cx-169]
MTTTADDELFANAWALADRIPGWLTRAQARLLYDEARALAPGATMLEIGSHQGRSTVVLGQVANATGGTVIAIDPFVDGRLFGGAPTKAKFLSHLAEAGVQRSVRHVEDYSTQARPGWTEGLDLLYIDGKHDFWTFSDDLRWRAFLPPDAAILVHDAYSSIGVTLGILARVLFARDLTYVRREGSMALFRTSRPRLADRLRVVGELPWWLRNVGIKVLLRLRLRPLARLVGHDSPYDPY